MAFPLQSLLRLFASEIVLFILSAEVGADILTAKFIRPERELLITAPAIVDSDAAQFPGPWSFGHLIQELAGPEGASACTREWLNTWRTAQTVNGQIVRPRLGINEKVIEPWQRRDGYNPASGKPWEPKLENAPFRLLAVVNRLDLCAPEQAKMGSVIEGAWRVAGKIADFERLLTPANSGALTNASATSWQTRPSGYGFGGEEPSFGQGRLVFGAVDTTGAPLQPAWTLIFEYKLLMPLGATGDGSPAATVIPGPREWAQAWHALGEIAIEDQRFSRTLQTLTRSFTDGVHRAASGGGTPKTALAQLRSSEAVFGSGREFRQFALSNGALNLAPLPQTPGPAFGEKHSRQQRALAGFLREQDPLIRSGLHNLPLTLEVQNETPVSMLGGRALIPADKPNFHWEGGDRVSHDARRIFSLNTCNGCHAGETASDGLHIHARAVGESAQLSEFLRMDGKPHRVTDPTRGAKTEFREMEDRAVIFAALLEPRERSRLDSLRDILRTRLRRTH